MFVRCSIILSCLFWGVAMSQPSSTDNLIKIDKSQDLKLIDKKTSVKKLSSNYFKNSSESTNYLEKLEKSDVLWNKMRESSCTYYVSSKELRLRKYHEYQCNIALKNNYIDRLTELEILLGSKHKNNDINYVLKKDGEQYDCSREEALPNCIINELETSKFALKIIKELKDIEVKNLSSLDRSNFKNYVIKPNYEEFDYALRIWADYIREYCQIFNPKGIEKSYYELKCKRDEQQLFNSLINEVFEINP